MNTPWSTLRALIAAFGLVGALASPVVALPGDNCSGDYYVDHTFASGAKWQLCWAHNDFTGIEFYDLYYTTPGGSARKVLAEARIAQIHVPYDDNGARFHDASDYGLGGGNMDDLDGTDCPGGSLLRDGSKDVLCQQVSSEERYRSGGRNALGETLRLFSVTHVGAYNYIPVWNLRDDGVIEPVMGATGRLQRFGSNTTRGWPIRSGSSTTGINHIHNYYWMLDFDFSEGSTDVEVIEEIDHVRVGSTREKQVTALATEASRSVDPTKRRSWRVRDGSQVNAAGQSISYQIEPGNVGHRHLGPTYEEFTQNEFYATRYDACEIFASHNSTAGGCGENLADFVDGESIDQQDTVIWYGITFHHTPTNEDEPNMHAHWDGFEIVPRDWTAENPITAAPEITSPGATAYVEGSAVTLPIAATDPDAGPAALSYVAEGLPAGLSIATATGIISGTLTAPVGVYTVEVRATDSIATDRVRFDLTVGVLPACSNGVDDDGDGATDHPADPGCSSPTDDTETDAALFCDDGLDNDGDGLVDAAADPGCSGPSDPSETDPATICDDGLDNDGDGLVDVGLDPGCANGADGTETDPALICDDGLDNDGDGLADFPNDPGCLTAADPDEIDLAMVCDDGIDNDGDGLADFPLDPGCASLGDSTETNPVVACDDGVDNDGDGFVDYPTDPGCRDSEFTNEQPQCQDGVDNDNAAGTDFDGGLSALGPGNEDPLGADPHCQSFYDNREAESNRLVCGVGPELALLLPALWGARRRTRRRR